MWRGWVPLFGKVFEDNFAQGTVRALGEYLQMDGESFDVPIVLRGIELQPLVGLRIGVTRSSTCILFIYSL